MTMLDAKYKLDCRIEILFVNLKLSIFGFIYSLIGPHTIF